MDDAHRKARRTRLKKKYFPTRKWWTLLVTTTATVVQMLWVGDGINTDQEKITTIGLVAGLALTYITPNKKEE